MALLVDFARINFEEKLRKLASQATDPPGAERLNPRSGNYYVQMGWCVGNIDTFQLEEFGKQILGYFSQRNTHYWYGPFGQGSTRISPLEIAMWAVAQARFRPPEIVLAEIRELFGKNTVVFNEYVWLWGISVNEAVDLGVHGLRLVPVDLLPPSQFKDTVTRVPLLIETVNSPVLNSLPNATAVLRRSITVSSVIREAGSEIVSKSESLCPVMKEIGEMLVVVAGVPVVPWAYSLHVEPGTPYILAGGGSTNACRP
jgi:hypothetical protein